MYINGYVSKNSQIYGVLKIITAVVNGGYLIGEVVIYRGSTVL